MSSKLANHIVVGVAKAGFVETHAGSQTAENLGVRQRFSGRRQRGPRELQVVVAVGEVKIGVFQKRGGRQDDIREIGGVGLKLLEHDREQIVAPQPLANAVLIRRNGGGIRIVDDQGACTGGSVDVGQRLARARHVDDAALRGRAATRVAGQGVSSAARLR